MGNDEGMPLDEYQKRREADARKRGFREGEEYANIIWEIESLKSYMSDESHKTFFYPADTRGDSIKFALGKVLELYKRGKEISLGHSPKYSLKASFNSFSKMHRFLCEEYAWDNKRRLDAEHAARQSQEWMEARG